MMRPIIIIAIISIVWSLGVLGWIFYEYVIKLWLPQRDRTIETKQKICLEKKDKITITNVTMWCPKGINPLAILEFIGVRARRSSGGTQQ